MSRLAEFKRKSVQLVVAVQDQKTLYEKTDEYVDVDADDLSLRLYEALARCQGNFTAWGISLKDREKLNEKPEVLLKLIEDEFYEMSKSFFFRFFKVPPS